MAGFGLLYSRAVSGEAEAAGFHGLWDPATSGSITNAARFHQSICKQTTRVSSRVVSSPIYPRNAQHCCTRACKEPVLELERTATSHRSDEAHGTGCRMECITHALPPSPATLGGEIRGGNWEVP